MNNKIYFISVFVLTCLFSALSYGQDIDKESETLISDQDKFITLSQVNENIPSQENGNLSSEVSNSIFIQQIGADNIIRSNITAKFSDINILQNGNENRVELEEFVKETEKVITQTGNNNSVVDFTINPDISTSLELIQEGNNLIFERYGANELSKNLKFKMTGEAKTIIVRSF
ncbi:hypothetical protein U6A24_04500 [Aquimarina gracilis]|uniref:Auto-transporter adhesin head GIN domain-containing protein n=1 Tax=Aquimarina gracilis TaxID=874422 RepID=A0ABU5ZSC5_9FLAO|nr:hypothetical protein [Aquimarina gracilis]MEB3344706.1 hypothetical protein [Aquimarina gracilis]